MPIFYGNTASTMSCTSDILWMGSGSNATTTSTCYTAGTSDFYMWNGGNQYSLGDYQAQAAQMQHSQMLAYQQNMQAVRTQDRQSRYEAELRARVEADRLLLQRRIEAEQPACDRAKELLLSHLTPAQKESFEKNKWFVVTGGRSKREYRIRTEHTTVNIDVLDGKKVLHKLCAHPNNASGVPLCDRLLAQKLMLEASEDDFLKIANRHAA